MGTERYRAGAATALALAALSAGTLTGAGTAAAQTGGIRLVGEAHNDCTVTITLTNHTNSTFYQPDWWFAEENDPAMVDALTLPETMPFPWRAVSGIPWPMARWVGDPVLHSGVAEGIPTFPGARYNTNAQPEGFVTAGSIDLRAAENAPEAAADGTLTIYFRVKSGPVTGDQLRTPQELVVTGCAGKGGGSSDWGSGDWGSVGFGSVIPGARDR